MTIWKRSKPHWKGIYLSRLGKISKVSNPKGKGDTWLLEPVPKYYYCKTLKEAKQLAEETGAVIEEEKEQESVADISKRIFAALDRDAEERRKERAKRKVGRK